MLPDAALTVMGAMARSNKSVNTDAQKRPLPSVALFLGAGYVRR